MADVKGLLADPEFQKLDVATQKTVLGRVDPAFQNLSDSDYSTFRQRMQSPSVPSAPKGDPPQAGFLDSFWKTWQGPRDTLQGLANATMHPIDTLRSIGESNARLMDKTGEAFRKGNVIGGIRAGINTGINSVLPGMGEQSEDAGQAFDRGSYREGFGKTAGVGVNAAQTALAGRYARPIANAAAETVTPGVKGPIGRTVSAARRLNPEVATEQAFRPAPTDSEFPSVAPSAFSDVKTFGGAPPRGIFGRAKVGVKQLAPGGNTTTAIETMQQQGLEPWMERARSAGVQISGDQIVSDVRGAIPELMWTKDPAGAQAIVDQAQRTWGGKQFTPDQFRDFLKTGNAGLTRFYNQSGTAQQAASTAGSAPAISEAEISGIRRSLYKALDPEGEGAGPRQVQERTGAVMDLRNAAERRSNAILGEKPVSPIAAAGRVLAAPAELATLPFRANPEPILSRSLHPIIGKSDALIQGLYRQAPEALPLPRPGGEYPAPPRASFVRPFANPNRLLSAPSGVFDRPAAPIIEPKPTEYVRPHGTLYTPPPADTSGPIAPVGKNAPFVKPMPRLTGPTQTPAPGFATGTIDLRPSIGPTGKVEYLPDWMRQGRRPLRR